LQLFGSSTDDGHSRLSQRPRGGRLVGREAATEVVSTERPRKNPQATFARLTLVEMGSRWGPLDSFTTPETRNMPPPLRSAPASIQWRF
jgi:hypothetical protein